MKNSLIYVAGNPELYPLEYYDEAAETYRGAIPDLLSAFAQENACELIYYQPGSADSRAEMAENIQVDIISGVVSGERFENLQCTLPLFSAQLGEEYVEYSIAFTSAAPEALINEMEAFVQARSESSITGELLAAVETPPQERSATLPIMIGLGIALCISLALLATTIRKNRTSKRMLEAQRNQDPETGLLNQTGLEKVYHEKVNMNNRVLYYLTCFHFDLNHIERISGPGEIKRLYTFAADTIRRLAMGDAEIAHNGTGDFFILQRNLSADAAYTWASYTLQVLKAYSCAGIRLNKRDVSIGIFPLSARDYDFAQMLYYVRQCAIAAGRDEQGPKVCCAENCRLLEEERELLSDFDQALITDAFKLDLQFFVTVQDFSVAGGEVLSRWIHPKKGLLNPERYIPLLEREGCICRLDFYNLEKTCRILQQIHKAGKEPFSISCNFSRYSFLMPDLIQRFREIVERYDFPREQLIIEITESGFIKPDDAPQMRQNIHSLHLLGVQILLDDFGMGYTTFRELQEYTMNGLKLDKKLIDMIGTEKGRIIVAGIIETGHKLGMQILAEGIEQEWQALELQKLNCDLLQGFFFAKPLPVEEALNRALY